MSSVTTRWLVQLSELRKAEAGESGEPPFLGGGEERGELSGVQARDGAIETGIRTPLKELSRQQPQLNFVLLHCLPSSAPHPFLYCLGCV